jgi:ABC-2 type transport system permease protein
MTYLLKQLSREWRFMLRQRYVLILLLCSFLVSGFAVLTGLSEVNQQRETIQRLKLADEIDRKEAQEKYDSPGMLAYYTFHLTYSEPSDLAFAALGERDIYPWKHRVRMLALEGQIYESDSQNPELAQAGKIDFVFVISALSPLFIILLFHDLIASERNSGRYDLLLSTAKSKYALWWSRGSVRFFSLLVCLMLPFYIGALISATGISSILIVTAWCIAYLAFWTTLAVWLGKKVASAPRIASGLIACWVLLTFVLPILSDLIINHSVESPKGGDILLVQREAVNDAWDLPVSVTMQDFVAVHPDYKGYQHVGESFDWGWYYAFQQVGDQKAADLSRGYRAAAAKKQELAAYATFISPPLLLQRKLTRLAQTDALAAFEYEQQIREFHRALRLVHYPWLFNHTEFDKAQLTLLPQFDNFTNDKKRVHHEQN